MEDSKIIELYWDRDEQAISETKNKYGRYCHSIAYNILHSNMDAEECVNDTYVKTWNTIPPSRPVKLCAFVGRITRNTALDRYDASLAQKRDGGTALVLDEMAECLPCADETGNIAEEYVLKEAINGFLKSLPQRTRIVFMRRYWYLSSIEEIATDLEMSESNVKVTLMRTRTKFREYLTRKGINI